jgi:glycosyltransferase involved in cell wall biosynthesis
MTHVPTKVIFSVVIPTYNRANLLPRAIQSVCTQTFGSFELIVVDDHSSDHTPEVVETFDDPRIVYLRQEENKGVAAARNAGIHLSRGKYIAFLDDDDEYLPTFLEQVETAFAAALPEVGFGWCGVLMVRDVQDGQEVVSETLWRPSFSTREEAYLHFLGSRRIGTNCGLTVRSSCFDSVGLFDESLRKAEDTDLLIRMAREFEFLVVPATLVKVHVHAGSRLTTYDRQMAEAYERILEKHKKTLLAHPSLRAKLQYKTGWLSYHAGNKIRGRRLLLAAIRARPWHMENWLALILFEMAQSQGPRLHRAMSLARTQLSMMLDRTH